jgi:hypothetical protein
MVTYTHWSTFDGKSSGAESFRAQWKKGASDFSNAPLFLAG